MARTTQLTMWADGGQPSRTVTFPADDDTMRRVDDQASHHQHAPRGPKQVQAGLVQLVCTCLEEPILHARNSRQCLP